MPQTQRTTKTIKGEQTMTKCLLCKKELEEEAEYICNKCHTEQMRKDVEYLMAQKDNEDERSEAWRFIDNRRSSVFKRD